MDSEGTKQLFVLAGLVVAVVGMLANCFVIAAISGDKMMRGNSMYLLLANLVSSTTFWERPEIPLGQRGIGRGSDPISAVISTL